MRYRFGTPQITWPELIAIVCFVCLGVVAAAGCKVSRPAPPEFTDAAANATTLSDAIRGMTRLFGALGPYVQPPGKPLLKFGQEMAGEAGERAAQNESHQRELQRKYQDMTDWGTAQQARADAVERSWGYQAEYWVRFYWRILKWSIVVIAIAGAVGRFLIGGLAGSILSWPARYLLGLMSQLVGLRTPIKARTAR